MVNLLIYWFVVYKIYRYFNWIFPLRVRALIATTMRRDLGRPTTFARRLGTVSRCEDLLLRIIHSCATLYRVRAFMDTSYASILSKLGCPAQYILYYNQLLVFFIGTEAVDNRRSVPTQCSSVGGRKWFCPQRTQNLREIFRGFAHTIAG